MGAYGLTTSFGWSAGPFLGGVLLDRYLEDPVILWGWIASIALAAAAGFWRWRGMFAGQTGPFRAKRG
jgi:hypothetical protein